MIAPGDTRSAEEPDSPITWEGTWNNRKYNTSGPLRCTAERKKDGSYEALFEGTFMGSPFDYKVPVKAIRQGNQTLLESSPTIDGDPYEWTGSVRGRVLSGQFRSAKGNNGEFRLQETSAAKKQ
jgi:hypothetical protein